MWSYDVGNSRQRSLSLPADESNGEYVCSPRYSLPSLYPVVCRRHHLLFTSWSATSRGQKDALAVVDLFSKFCPSFPRVFSFRAFCVASISSSPSLSRSENKFPVCGLPYHRRSLSLHCSLFGVACLRLPAAGCGGARLSAVSQPINILFLFFARLFLMCHSYTFRKCSFMCHSMLWPRFHGSFMALSP